MVKYTQLVYSIVFTRIIRKDDKHAQQNWNIQMSSYKIKCGFLYFILKVIFFSNLYFFMYICLFITWANTHKKSIFSEKRKWTTKLCMYSVFSDKHKHEHTFLVTTLPNRIIETMVFDKGLYSYSLVDHPIDCLASYVMYIKVINF